MESISPELPKEAQSFDQFYAVQEQGHTLKAIFRAGLGFTEFPPEIVPYSFISQEDLARIGALLALQECEVVADIACGNGSIGLWLMQQSGAQLMGVDVAPAALTLARSKAQALGAASSPSAVSPTPRWRIRQWTRWLR